MGRNSKQRRDAKRAKSGKARAVGSRSRTSSAWFDERPPADVVAATADDGVAFMLEAIVHDHPLARHLADVWRGPPTIDADEWRRALGTAVVVAWVERVRAAYALGWWPHELPRIAERRSPKVGGALALAVLAYERSTDPDPSRSWSFDRLPMPTDPGTPLEIALRSAQMSGGSDEITPAWVEAALRALAPIATAARGHMPPPTAKQSVDAGVLARVRALLAQAESTTFEEEAETFAAKAQQLISRHAIDEALLAGEHGSDQPVLRRIPIDDPYFDAKGLLLGSVATANRCSTVLMGGQACVAVVGYPSDLDLVEVLFTSLLVQAVSGMARATKAVTGGRTRSYRQSFLLGFSRRIGDRLAATDAAAVDDASRTAAGAGLLPVLAGRRSAVDEATATLFPNTRRLSVSDSNPHGRYAGMAAADLVDLAVGTPVTATTVAGDLGDGS